MIKSLATIRLARDRQDFERLLRFFDALGLERGDRWQDATSRGMMFNAPFAMLGVVEGTPPADAYIMVEVSDLESAHAIARKQQPAELSDITETGWGSRVFIAQPAAGVRVAFWQYLSEAEGGPKTEEGLFDARGLRFGIVVSRFNSFITERLLAGALDALRRTGAMQDDIHIVRVPGAFEVPGAARTLAKSGKYDAVLCLACLLRGETDHYDHLAAEVTRGIGQSQQETGVPHAYGVLTCDTLDQAIDRAGLKSGNKGFEAALSAIEMASMRKDTTEARRRGGKASKKPQTKTAQRRPAARPKQGGAKKNKK
jgi:6,7-dimethyl-8-ribityllumazine synthase